MNNTILTIARILGILLMLFSINLIIPFIITLYCNDNHMNAFVIPFLIINITGFILWSIGKNSNITIRNRDGFIVVCSVWIIISIFAALPFIFISNISWHEALFETVSGLTTTGASILSNIDDLPKSIIYYRQQLQFLGGMGIILLSIAIMPFLGIGGMQLYKLEVNGPIKDNKMTPRITETAKIIWGIYLMLNLICIISYWICGMSLFDSVNYAFATVSTGGFSPHSLGIAYYDSYTLYFITMIFMLIGGTNFTLHFLAIRNLKYNVYFKNYEFISYIIIIFIISVIVSIVLWINHIYVSGYECIIKGIFNVISFSTTTGFEMHNNYDIWPAFLQILLMIIGFIGACSGSTTGGVKILRCLILKKQISCEIKQLIHPQGKFPIKIGHDVISDKVMNGIWAYFSAYIIIFILLWLLLIIIGENSIVAFIALSDCITNVGLNISNNNLFHISNTETYILTAAMLIGRLEILTILVFLSPEFWRK
jgi:trk system potassium uptake protein TrkH